MLPTVAPVPTCNSHHTVRAQEYFKRGRKKVRDIEEEKGMVKRDKHFRSGNKFGSNQIRREINV